MNPKPRPSLKPSARPSRPAPGNRRFRLVLVLALAVAVGVPAAYFLIRDPDVPNPEATSMALPAPANPARELMPSEVADPLEARKLAERQEQRARFEAMRDGFAGSQRESAASRARLEPALRALWPALPPTFAAICRERLCRVAVPGGAPEARAALVADAGVRRVVDGVFVDPDHRDPIAYVMLVSPGASPGEDLLSGVEREFFLSSDGRECLSSAGAVGSVEYELRVDTSGFTYRSRTDLPRTVLECVNEALDGIIATTEVPREVKSASRTFALRR